MKLTSLPVLLIGMLIQVLSFGCSGGGSNSGGAWVASGTGASLVSIDVSPKSKSIAVGTGQQFTATGFYSDSTRRDITKAVVWSTSDSSTATVGGSSGNYGFVQGCNPGTTDITASSGSIQGGTTLTVTPAVLTSIQVSPSTQTIALGTQQQFTAIGIYSDNTRQDLTTSVSWSSSSAAAAFSNAAGLEGNATGMSPGAATITAAAQGQSGTALLTVTGATLQSIQINPVFPVIPLGTDQQFTAVGIYSDNTVVDLTSVATWTSSSPDVASVSNAAGSYVYATSLNVGTTTITASYGGQVDSTDLEVSNAALASIQITPADQNVALGTTLQMTATGIYTDNSVKDITTLVTWSSSSPSIAGISNSAGSNGFTTSTAIGKTTINATMQGISGSTPLTVTSATLTQIQIAPISPSIALGMTGQFTAVGVYSDNSVQDLTASVVWSSSNTAVATVSNAAGSYGLASALQAGSATIKATLDSVSGTTTVLVTAAILQSIDVTPALPSVAVGTTQQFSATGTYSDNTIEDLTSQVLWSSSSTTVAVISNAPGSNGLATPLSTGMTTITASLKGVSGGTDVQVTNASLQSIDVTPINPTVSVDLPQQFTATGNYSDGTTQDLTSLVTWVSSDTSVATISNAAGSNGFTMLLSPGTTTITAWFDNVPGTSTLTVTPYTLQSIVVTGATSTIAAGTMDQFTATGYFSDGSTQDITTNVVWTSSNTNVATVSNMAGSNGLATGIAAGKVTITAAIGSKTGNANLVVTSARLQSIAVTPANTTLMIGVPTQYTATGAFSDGTTQDLTSQVTWKSLNPNIVTVSNKTSTKGLATPAKAGSTTISATYINTNTTGQTNVTVSSATLNSILITPTDSTIRVKQTEQLTATAYYSDGSSQDITKTPSLNWYSSNTSVATIINKPPKKKGLATGINAGTVTVTVKMKGASPATATLTVK